MMLRAVDPVVIEAARLHAELARTRRALAADRARGLADADAAALLGLAAHRLTARLEEIMSSDADRAAVDAARTRRAAALRLAARARRAERDAGAARDRAQRLRAHAAAAGRALTAAEADAVAQLEAAADRPDDAWEAGIDSAETRDAVLTAIATARIRDARRQLADGVLETAQMRRIVAEALPAVRRGDPVLLLGETGGAKTALAEHLARRSTGAAPEFVSGHGDITSAQVIGAHELRAEAGATVSDFVPGPLLRAMRDGRALILDEVNAMPPEFLKRLNRVLQLRPGDAFAVQERAGRAVTVAPGFAIIATANEQTPHRYRGLDRLSAELTNRFGANAYRVHYPDTGNDFTDVPRENLLLATAAATDAAGELPPGLSPGRLERVARAAFISQQVFAGTHGEGFDGYVSTEREVDGRPGLEEAVLAPRTLVAIVQKVAGSGGAVTLEQALRRFVEGVMHREDRRVLALILQGQGFAL